MNTGKIKTIKHTQLKNHVQKKIMKKRHYSAITQDILLLQVELKDSIIEYLKTNTSPLKCPFMLSYDSYIYGIKVVDGDLEIELKLHDIYTHVNLTTATITIASSYLHKLNELGNKIKKTMS